MSDWKNVVRATLREETAMLFVDSQEEHRLESAIRSLEGHVQEAARKLNDVLAGEGRPPAEVVKVARGAGFQFRPDRGRPFVWRLAVKDHGGELRVESEVCIRYPDGEMPEPGPLDDGALAHLTPEALCESFAEAYRIATDSSAA